mmetsp:Transcript_87697/g.246360  ORF Transcript_87697/g.246360 Transcript_87697/m.246360 type:complete len:403 (-) Transcript_87697:107-1315(-)
MATDAEPGEGGEMNHSILEDTIEKFVVPGTPGRPDTLCRVVRGHIPGHLEAELLRDFTEAEIQLVFHRVDILVAEENHERPKALWIFGPPAVGKTTMSEIRGCDIFGRPHNAVVVDGAEFRKEHRGFQDVVRHGIRNNLVYADAWKKFKATGVMDRMKHKVVDRAIKHRQHLRIPEAAANVDRVYDMFSKLKDAGYEMHAIFLWAPKSETETRGRPRALKEGKRFSPSVYAETVLKMMRVAQHWEAAMAAGEAQYFRSATYLDNTLFPAKPLHVSAFRDLAQLSDEDADAYARERKASQDADEVSEMATRPALSRGVTPAVVAHVTFADAPSLKEGFGEDAVEPGGTVRRDSLGSDISDVERLVATKQAQVLGTGILVGFTASFAVMTLAFSLWSRRHARLH